MIEKPRLLPAVILGAMGLLALKLLGWSTEHPAAASPSPRPAAAAPADNSSGAEVWGLAKVIARAHAPDAIMDPMVTGAIDKPPVPKETPLPAEHPANRAEIMNAGQSGVSAAERALLERLGQRREEIEARMRELEMRERLLDAAEKKLESKAGELKQGEEKAAAGVASPAAEEAKAVRNLVIMYEAMKPKDAARVFDRLSLDVLVPVVQQMNPRKMSEVLAAMSPERAEKLTIALASHGRSAAFDRPSTERVALPANELPAIPPPMRR